MQVISNEKASLSSLRVKTLDGPDGGLWVQSSIAPTHKWPRGHSDDFSFSRSDLVILHNVTEDFLSIRLECIGAAEAAIFIGSTRRGSKVLRPDSHGLRVRMQPGEVLTVRSLFAVEPKPDMHGNPIPIRTGHNRVSP